ncbi:core-2 i-branching beta--n-acetylglucosaminyltransferase family protein [Stylonychia lemnae]|uniref:Core-2 i-branching beta--n-acetylglucosaminyltransferase family protein n=1 Tax=Stylonychia lemnae TaxID=5949 RepID=A0A078A161_STYLE|nr:core-2 i-branching beta--n-acetylglucosaminyltransferase family protein [Stylonychia lemnae]|eukprot:CDW75986.1 core-2 i-branching beta--n-acetylglucosaminyltransferase family protein [Stylonychia lemnae]
MFFENADQNKYSIYYHSKQSKDDTALNITSKNKPINVPEVPTEWGTISIWLLMNQLLRYSFSDMKNQRFVFISQACIPLYSFDEIYEMVMKEENSQIFYADKAQIFPRYGILDQYFSKSQIVKHHQWVLFTRKHVSLLLSEKSKWEANLQSLQEKQTKKEWFPDEAIYGTLLNHYGQQDSITNKCVTYVDWKYQSGVVRFELVDKDVIFEARTQGCLFLRKIMPETQYNENALDLVRGKKK